MTTPRPAESERFHAAALGIGEIGVGRDQGQLRTFVGSCVGLALYDRRIRIAGLAHIMLPDSQGAGTPAGKYVDTAIPEMLRISLPPRREAVTGWASVPATAFRAFSAARTKAR